MAAKTQIVKYIGERGITAAKKFFGNSKTSGVASLSDEQLGRGLNMFEKKKADKAGAKAGAKSEKSRRRAAKARRAEMKEANRTKKREPGKGGTQKNLRFRDKPTINIDVESDASRSVDETNLIRGAASAGRSTNRSGRTNIGSKSIANFIEDQRRVSPGMAARDRENKAYAAYIKAAPNKKEKAKRQAEFDKIKTKRRTADKKQAAQTAKNISQGLRAKSRKGLDPSKPTPKGKPDALNEAIKDINEGKGDLGKAFDDLLPNQQKKVLNHAKAVLTPEKYRRFVAVHERDALRRGDAPQLERAGVREVQISPRVLDESKKLLMTALGNEKGAKAFKKILSGATSKREFLAEIRSMVKEAKGKAGNKSGDIGAVVRGRGSSLDDASPSRGRKMMRGGMAKKPRTGSIDYRNGGMVMSTGNNLKKVPAGNKGLKKLPTAVRNRMGFMARGGVPKKK